MGVRSHNMLNWLNCTVKLGEKKQFDKEQIGVKVRIFWGKKNLRRIFDKYAVARTEHDTLVKSTTKIFSNFVAFSKNPNFKEPLPVTNCQFTT